MTDMSAIDDLIRVIDPHLKDSCYRDKPQDEILRLFDGQRVGNNVVLASAMLIDEIRGLREEIKLLREKK